MSTAHHVLFAGGGTPGHIFPGLAVAEHLQRQMPHCDITFAGGGSARERHAVRSAGFHYTVIPSQPSPHNPLQALRFVTDNVAGYCAARWMLREQRVSMVVGLGGFTSTAIVRAAAARGIPVILMEQNAVPGRTTRWLSRAATLVCAAYEEVRPHLHVQAPVTVTGNPARIAFEELYRRVQQRKATRGDGPDLSLVTDQPYRQRRLVVLGGAAGARSLNEAVPAALKKLGDRLHGWQVIHQTGEGQLQETEARYAQHGVQALAVTYIDEIASVLFASDLAISRAGGMTLAELALAGTPSVLVPYPQAIDNHQTANAKVFTAAGACRMIDESSQTGALDAALARELEPLLANQQMRTEMTRNIGRLARPDAAAEVAGAVRDHLCGGFSSRLAA
ncbi:MAG: undecaprenyldiphospho-muramoylpentapeptide beta-N-acetylglucosaminyltransferase [Planctomycetaceae bacterium]|nr:undecaprenyldiphospho-muramoylpentapeptide beta-N-acetylglucosaminyltransferase [Planctomycetaceae bacterium]